MKFTPVPFLRVGLLGHLLSQEWRTDIRCMGMALRIEVARITVDIRDGRVFTRGWHARIVGRGPNVRAMIAYYDRVDEVFGTDGLGTRGYGRTREEAVRALQSALRDGRLLGGPLYAPPQYDFSYGPEGG